MDWKRRRAYVKPSSGPGVSGWFGMPQAQSFASSDPIRRVLLGADPHGASLTRRAQSQLDTLREDFADRVEPDGTVLAQDKTRMRWWTWAGARANAVLTAALDAVEPELLGETLTYDNWQIALRSDATARWASEAMRTARKRFGSDLSAVLPLVDERAVERLKFSETLPPELAQATLAARMADHPAAASIAAQVIVQRTSED